METSNRTESAFAPMPSRWLNTTPIESNDKPCTLEALEVTAHVSGLYAKVSEILTIGNPNISPISTDVEIAMPDGAVVCGYGLEIDGEIRDGVVVPKEQARVVFETERRRGADPGLVESVRGNLYKTRVYPVPANGSRRIRLDYVAPLSFGSDGQATYVMVLKDSANLIRKYAMVNAESYNVVAVEDTLEQCRSSYEDAMWQADISFEGDGQEMPAVSADGETGSSDGKQSKDTEFNTTVTVMQLADKDGTTYAYILGDDGNLYVVGYASNAKALMTLSAGKTISGTAHDDGNGSMIVTTFVTEATAK